MKNFFKRFKKYSFWISFAGALIVFLDALGRAFGFVISNQIVEDCILAFAGILVVCGIVTMDVKKENDDKTDDENNE